jgi:hypothetical protein
VQSSWNYVDVRFVSDVGKAVRCGFALIYGALAKRHPAPSLRPTRNQSFRGGTFFPPYNHSVPSESTSLSRLEVGNSEINFQRDLNLHDFRKAPT